MPANIRVSMSTYSSTKNSTDHKSDRMYRAAGVVLAASFVPGVLWAQTGPAQLQVFREGAQEPVLSGTLSSTSPVTIEGDGTIRAFCAPNAQGTGCLDIAAPGSTNAASISRFDPLTATGAALPRNSSDTVQIQKGSSFNLEWASQNAAGCVLASTPGLQALQSPIFRSGSGSLTGLMFPSTLTETAASLQLECLSLAGGERRTLPIELTPASGTPTTPVGCAGVVPPAGWSVGALGWRDVSSSDAYPPIAGRVDFTWGAKEIIQLPIQIGSSQASLGLTPIPDGGTQFKGLSYTISTCPADFNTTASRIPEGCHGSINPERQKTLFGTGSGCTLQVGVTYYLNLVQTRFSTLINDSSCQAAVCGVTFTWR